MSLSEELNITVGGGLYFIAKEAEAVLLDPAKSEKVFVATDTSIKTSEDVGETVNVKSLPFPEKFSIVHPLHIKSLWASPIISSFEVTVNIIGLIAVGEVSEELMLSIGGEKSKKEPLGKG